MIYESFITIQNRKKLALTRAPWPTSAMIFCASWPWPLTVWPQNQWVSRTHGGTFLCQVWWSKLHRLLKYRVEKQKQTNRHTNAAEKPTHATTVGVGNDAHQLTGEPPSRIWQHTPLSKEALAAVTLMVEGVDLGPVLGRLSLLTSLVTCWQLHVFSGQPWRPRRPTCCSSTVNWTPTTGSAAGRPTRRRGSTTGRRAPARRSSSAAVSAIRTASCRSRYATASACCESLRDRTPGAVRVVDRRAPWRRQWRHRPGAVPRCRHGRGRPRRHRRARARSSTAQGRTAVGAALPRTCSAARCASVPTRARSVPFVVILYVSQSSAAESRYVEDFFKIDKTKWKLNLLNN